MALTELEILEQISKHWVSFRRKANIQQNSCILACNFARQILIRHNVDHEVLPVGTTVFNRRGWELFGIPANQLPDDAWHVHCSSQSLGKGFGGHVIIQTKNYFFDPTVGSFSRPEKEMMFGETVIVPLADMEVHARDSHTHPIHLMFRTDKFWTFPIGSGLYSYYFEKWNTIYRRSPDWQVSPNELGIPDIVADMRRDVPQLVRDTRELVRDTRGRWGYVYGA